MKRHKEKTAPVLDTRKAAKARKRKPSNCSVGRARTLRNLPRTRRAA